MDSKKILKTYRWRSEMETGKGYYQDGDKLILDRRLQETLRLAGSIKPRKNYLDIGCRDGFLTDLISKETGNPLTYGIDLVDPKEAQKRGIKCLTFDLEGKSFLPFKGSSFDLITCNEVLEHIRDTDFLIEEIYRILTDDGYLIMSIPRLDSLLTSFLLLTGYQPIWVECSIQRRYGGLTSDGMITGHVSYFTRKAILEMMGLYNFKIIASSQVSVVTQWLLDQYILKRKIPLFKRMICKILDIIPFKQDTLIMLIKKNTEKS
ncbi:MAG TPA: class I SAM-dependent methyltransferase [Candidatus Eremiobacteraeota bacterium]|nr:class I SAM-dependent methyltransferase [Candidatus Eremiobacteraeota bacterium]